eukprot:CAMPEP_0202701118 /NCGR_PEP_ID=MMETSP1385-20130828/14230_1 /ASSEMBLY_ACC=CAM_ASM_000861 /TAXON_ID=933848 /ORGANISM="Elphidium margaritaceum" /LENGTH=249 /DNA_ID=CAMNT_0049358461 /DNA_START=20 /DNA_END=769 /DNA_ORIENTATION=-
MPFILSFTKNAVCDGPGLIILGLLASGGWTIAYIACVYIGFKQKTYCIPFVTLMINFAWELYFTFSAFQCAPNKWCVQRVTNVIWTILDTLIVISLLVYGFKYFEKIFHKVVWYSTLLFIFCSALTFIILFQESFDPTGGISAFSDNYLMSCLFIPFYYVRKAQSGYDLNGQSLVIAISKCIGTLATSIAWGGCSGNDAPILLYIYVMITLLDLYYIALLVYSKYKGKDQTQEKAATHNEMTSSGQNSA